jgi:non-canonical poly(A) RNA polymerase PAPD5/7
MGAEVQAFANWIRPTEAEVAARETVIQQTTQIIEEFAQEYKVEVFGSSRNGLGLASSDIDLRLYQDWDKPEELENWMPAQPTKLPPTGAMRKMNLGALHRLQGFFFRHPDYILCNIRHARYPLLHMQHKPSGIDVQVVCSNDTSVQRARIAKYLKAEPQIFDLYAVLKTLLDIRGLTDVFRGGLGSYNILIMIVTALQKAKQYGYQTHKNAVQDHSPANHEEKLGMDLSQVLGFYGQFLDTYKFAVLADPFALVPKLDPSTIKDLNPVSSTL